MTKQATIDLLKQQLPGFYSVEQVIDMISKIETGASFELNDQQIKELVNNVVDEIKDLGIDAFDDYDLSMNGREVEIDSVDISDYSVSNAVKSAVNNWVEWFKDEENK
jgi:hypothetical protein